MLSYSCEKESLSTASSPTKEEAALIKAVDVDIHGPAASYQSAAEISVNLQDGALQFSDVMEFRRVLNTLAQTSDEDYRVWAMNIDFNSPYVQYLDLREQIESEQGPLKTSVLNAQQEKFLFIDEDGVPRFKLPYFEMMKVVNLEEGIFKIGSTINYYTPEYHFVIPDNKYDVLEMVQNDLLADYSAEGVIVEGIEVQSSDEQFDGEEKVELRSITCPTGVETSSGVNIVIRVLTDERRIDGNRQRLVSTLVLLSSIMFIDDEREIVQRMVVEYENERRSWFTWIGTQPGLRFAQAKDLNIPTPETGGPVDDEIFVTRNLRVFRTFLLGGLAGFVNVFDINNVPITESNSTTFTDPRNDTRGCGVFDDFSFNYTRPPNVLTEGDFDVSYIMLDGAARAYWYRRDTRGGLDHVSGDFHCN